jgi:alanine dehydrogenase
MKIGCVKEIKKHEYRVGLTPSCVKSYVANGHSVVIQENAGVDAGFENVDYINAGATIETDVAKIFNDSEMIVKVKEPQASEYNLFHQGQILFTYLHLAADKDLTEFFLHRKVNSFAYETIRAADGSLPCLKPMSEIAGKLSIQEGAKYLERPFGGRGVLLGGVPGVARGKVSILGGGVVGTSAAKVAVGLGADVVILDVNANRLSYLDDIFNGKINTLFANETNIVNTIKESDLVVGAVLIPGAKAPRLIRAEHLSMMKKRSVIVDVAVDQGGCVETTRPTTHNNPVFTVDDVIHYCVANMPGAVSLTSTVALTSYTTPYGIKIANKGVEVVNGNQDLLYGLNTFNGKLTCKGVADAFGMQYKDLNQVGLYG